MHPTGRYASRFGLLTAATVLAWPLAAITPAQGATPAVAHQPAARAAANSAGRMIPAVGHPIRFRSTGFRARHLRPDLVLPCESNTAPVQCYEPRQIRTAYNVPGGLSGAGRSITIIDAFQSPTIGADLAAFSKIFDLARPRLRIIAPQGLTPFNSNDPDQVGWAAFHDITQGSNIWGPSGVTAGFRTHPRWDAVTGLGSPDIAKLIKQLIAR